ncbi:MULTISPECIES: Eco57I restriction-modification methylase domain-containing protein [Sphingobacterium]|uniref:Eco57I restriction-modification methylase domain-containing protein n=2 Tax=Sphingobacteriaceae TaxID=84566 RepID=UPI00257DD9D4|nr:MULTISPECIES: TaqI-like C-terminal specificity domain-containing protein [Sphingobacterium]
MDKVTLHKIFSKAFDDASWLEVLKSVFGAKLGLLAQPKPILLKSNDKANAAFELGSFTTTDDRIIGLYKIEVKPEVWLERNKVGLRELLRNVYQYDVDGAIIVFVQQEKWRLSFVSEIKVLNDEGEVIEQATEPKRYTYLLGEGEKVRTPSDRLSKLTGKSLALQDILNAFSVEALNEEFYKIIQAYFYELVGGKIGKGKKVTDYGKGILQLPSVPKENRQVYQEFAVRLIGRTVFCWFLKMKKSDAEAPLLPESLLSSKAVKEYSGYYHTILERLFFQTLNTPVEQRIENLPEGANQIPFLNGGLFEPGNQDYYKPSNITGLSQNLNTLNIDDQWFVKFFEELEKYNFTIDENSVTDVEVSVDPEMLGRIFENLLAEIDPDSGETARKATGSFYTPREIVDYMATESLVQYIHNKTNLPQDQLRPIFKMMDKQDFDFTKAETEAILDTLDQVKILDPACGSGAFPMGVLQKIVQALQKLDPDAVWWKKRQVARVSNAIVRKQLKEKMESSGVEYARKIGVIQNSLYGVDIQPVAAEISKLRCFLSLVVDENIDENKPNRGIEPLPNLEFKFVTADTLIKLPEENGQRGLFDNWEEMQELEELRNDYIQSYGKQKQRIKEQFLKVQQKMFKDQLSLFSDKESRAYQLSTWNPFGHEKSDWFDPKWMFGVEKFDVVIGNPPYNEVSTKEDKIKFQSIFKEVISKHYDVYIFFFKRGYDLVSEYGVLSYITPHTFTVYNQFQALRKWMIEKTKIVEISDRIESVFSSVVVDSCITILSNNPKHKKSAFKRFEFNQRGLQLIESETLDDTEFDHETFSISSIKNKEKLKAFLIDSKLLGEVYESGQGITVYAKVQGEKINYFRESIVSQNSKPVTKGREIFRYKLNWDSSYIEYGNWLWCQRDDKYFESPKIFLRQTSADLIATYIEEPFYCIDSVHSIITGDHAYNLKYLLCILNSGVGNYMYSLLIQEQGKVFAQVKLTFLRKIPIKQANQSIQSIFDNICTYTLATNKFKDFDKHVPNSHIAQLFEEVIDAMVMELYFKEDFEKAGIEFIKYAERDFESIEGKPQSEQIEIIHRAYQKLREKDNEIRNNLKLMDIKLADIVMPIKAAK